MDGQVNDERTALSALVRAEGQITEASATSALELAERHALLCPVSAARLACRAAEWCDLSAAPRILRLVQRFLSRGDGTDAIREALGERYVAGFERMHPKTAGKIIVGRPPAGGQALRWAACLMCWLLLGVGANAQENWSVARVGAEEAVLTAPGNARIRFAGITPQARLELLTGPTSSAAAVLLHFPQYSDVMLFRKEADGQSIGELKAPVLPGDTILKDFPRSGKPPGKQFRLTAMSIDRAGWGDAGRLALRARLFLVDEPSGDVSWFYEVDYVLTLPAVPMTQVELTLLNVVLRDGSGKR